MKRQNISFFLACLLTIGMTIISGCSSPSSSGSGLPPSNDIVDEYIDIEKSHELQLFATEHDTVPIAIGKAQYRDFLNFLASEDYTFSKGDYYGLNEVLNLYHSTTIQKSVTSDLLDSNGKIDASKLLSSVNANNKKEMANGKDVLNAFYSETSEADKSKICNLIAEVVNKICDDAERRQIANTLTAMSLFNRTGSASNAYVTNHLTFVYNPSMSEMYADVQQITGSDDKKSVMDSVLVHEIMHLIQHRSDDLLDENGIEVGICRTYNLDSGEPKVPVDSLWNTWLLEASAELGMADYLGIDTHTYAKKISYVISYNLSQFQRLTAKETLIENVAFSSTLEEAFAKLGLKTEEEQLEFLKFMYSVEILQTDPQEFWDNYTALTGLTPTDEEKLSIRLSIRSEVVKYLSYNFYTNLADAVYNRKITDLDTVFYLMRMWEIDCFGHLEYTKKTYLDDAKGFIEWHDKVQTKLLEALSAASAISLENLHTQYDTYYLQTKVNDIVSDNCDLALLHSFTGEYLSDTKSNYATGGFVRNRDILTYISQH